MKKRDPPYAMSWSASSISALETLSIQYLDRASPSFTLAEINSIFAFSKLSSNTVSGFSGPPGGVEQGSVGVVRMRCRRALESRNWDAFTSMPCPASSSKSLTRISQVFSSGVTPSFEAVKRLGFSCSVGFGSRMRQHKSYDSGLSRSLFRFSVTLEELSMISIDVVAKTFDTTSWVHRQLLGDRT